MAEPIIVIDSSEILAGNLPEVERAMRELVEFVQTNEPRPISYRVYLSDRGTRMTVVQIHPDSSSMEYHMDVAGPAFAKLTGLIKLSTMDIYGKPSPDLLERIRRKIELLGSAAVVVHDLHAGFARIETREANGPMARPQGDQLS